MKLVTIHGRKDGKERGSVRALGKRFQFGEAVKVSDADADKLDATLRETYNLTIRSEDD